MSVGISKPVKHQHIPEHWLWASGPPRRACAWCGWVQNSGFTTAAAFCAAKSCATVEMSVTSPSRESGTGHRRPSDARTLCFVKVRTSASRVAAKIAKNGGPRWDRTNDPLIKSQMLCH